MKILHICTQDYGGAGLCCLRINDYLNAAGICSKVLVLVKKTQRNDVYQYGFKKWLLWRCVNKLLRILKLTITDYNRMYNLSLHDNTIYSLPISIIDISKCDLVKEADIIHIHWIGNFVDLPSFAEKVKKPIIWTLHDENYFLGLRHFDTNTVKNSLEDKYYKIKEDAVNKINKLGLVFLSKMMYDKYKNNEMAKGRNLAIINNAVDCSKYKPIPKGRARNMYGIENDKIVFVFVAAVISDKRKGLDILYECINRMNVADYVILAIGDNPENKKWSNVISIGAIYDTNKLCAAYSCGDYFVMPSFGEAFAQSPLEAMACGLPAIVFPVSGTEELINPINGILCKGFSSFDLETGIKQALNKSYSSNEIRKDIINRFSPAIIAHKYIDFYKTLL